MKKDLLVTLADKNYINQAKQFFSSVYWNAGWKGDYMLLSHEIPEEELRWFIDKGILIKKCETFYDEEGKNRPISLFSKLYLLTPELKKWDNVIFLDADIIVRASLDELTKIKGFAAAKGHNKLSKLFFTPLQIKLRNINKKIFDSFRKEYNLNELSFNTGVMAFSTDIIEEETFPKLKKILEQYGKIVCADEAVFNLFFYKRWIKLPKIYNVSPYFLTHFNNIKPKNVDGVILHFYSDKPWNPRNYFYKEWKYNLDRAESIDLNKIPISIKKWDEQEIQEYLSYLERRCIKYFYKYLFWKINISIIRFIDRSLGFIGIYLKINYPKLYFKLKKIKNGKSKNISNNSGV